MSECFDNDVIFTIIDCQYCYRAVRAVGQVRRSCRGGIVIRPSVDSRCSVNVHVVHVVITVFVYATDVQSRRHDRRSD